MRIAVFFSAWLMCLGATAAPNEAATLDRGTWPEQLTSPALFDVASRAEILAFAHALLASEAWAKARISALEATSNKAGLINCSGQALRPSVAGSLGAATAPGTPARPRKKEQCARVNLPVKTGSTIAATGFCICPLSTS